MNEIYSSKEAKVRVNAEKQCDKQKIKHAHRLTLLINFFTSLFIVCIVIFHVISHLPLGVFGLGYIAALTGVIVSTAISYKQYRGINGGEK